MLKKMLQRLDFFEKKYYICERAVLSRAELPD